ncbi:MAG TPA: ferredoxin-type protein NapF [Gammaproteobacteria bacterium]|nr:ferredoxin-type protein NapF [Gammaproteobacteria bacterium]
MTIPDSSRRSFLRGHSSRREQPSIRPPWAKPEIAFTTSCSRCDSCIQACPEGILSRDGGGYPKVDFSRGECTFCRACVEACEQPVFNTATSTPPWAHIAAVGNGCFGQQGVYCRSCGESCEAGAIRFAFSSRSVPIPTIDASLCTGCGACVAACPAAAISVVPAVALEDQQT